MMITHKVIYLILFVVLSLAPVSSSQAEWVDWVLDAKLEYKFDDNINRSAFSEDKREDHLFSGQVSAGRFFQISGDSAKYTRLGATVDAELRGHDEFEDLNRVNIGATISLTHKFGLGWRVPWLNIRGSALRENVEDSDRNKNVYNVGLNLAKNFTERFQASVGVAYDIQDGQNDLPEITPGLPSDVYDLNRYILSTALNYQVTERILTTISYSYLDGDINGECTPGNVGEVLDTITVDAHTLDGVFQGCRYRFDGYVHTMGIGSSYALGRHSALNFGFGYSSGGQGDLTYDNMQATVNFKYRY